MSLASKSASTILTSKLSKDRSQIIKIKRWTTGMVMDDGFADKFKQICEEYNVNDAPTVVILASEPQAGPCESLPTKVMRKIKVSTSRLQLSSQPSAKSQTALAARRHEAKSATQVISRPNPKQSDKILAVYNTDDHTKINVLICKHFKMENDWLGCLQKTISICNTLTSLRLEFCNLADKQITAVKFTLVRCATIRDLYLDGNPNQSQNFYVLLKNTKLRFLSLRFCKIDDKGVAKLAGQLKNPLEQTLIGINLASNFISDNGAGHLADALRTNRCLTYMNLADNWIANAGCVSLMKVLQKFPLTHDEVVFRRKRKLEALRNKTSRNDITRSNSLPATKSTMRQKSLERYRVDRKSKSSNAIKGAKRRSKEKPLLSSSSAQLKNRSRKMSVNSSKFDGGLLKDCHPYMTECYPENKQIFNRGNFTLAHLNISYNKIAGDGLLAIIDVLGYQQANAQDAQNAGLTNIVIEGNDIAGCIVEAEQIAQLTAKASKILTSSPMDGKNEINSISSR